MHFSTSTKQQLILWAGLLLTLPTKAQTDIINTTPTGNTTRSNVYVGVGSGNDANSQGVDNTFVGYSTGRVNVSSENVFVGSSAGYSNIVGSNNVFVGSLAGYSNSNGYNNAFLGTSAGYANNTGFSNTFLGCSAGLFNSQGSNNTLLGNKAGMNNATGMGNVFTGSLAGNSNKSGNYNVFAGYEAGYYSITGYSNVAIGRAASFTNASGNNNVMIGDSAGFNNTVSDNVFVGSKAGYNNQTGQGNTFYGYHAGYTVTTGSNNIIIGPNSGTAVTDGSENVLMGYNSQAEDGLHNATAIGASSRVAVSNALILGNQANVGIGTSAPSTRLELVSDRPNDSGLRLTNLTTSSPATHSTDQFLTVNQKGEVIKAYYQLRINDVSQWSDKVFSSAYMLRPLSAVASYIGQHGHLPGIPSAEQIVRDGVDLVKMNALLLEKVEELTLYSIQQQQEIERLKQQQTKIDELERLVKQLLKHK